MRRERSLTNDLPPLRVRLQANVERRRHGMDEDTVT
jgi:hypothetical protein